MRELIMKVPQEVDVANYNELFKMILEWRKVGYHPNIIQLAYAEIINQVPRIVIECTTSLNL